MRTAHALCPAARACAHSSGAWQPTRRSASLRHGPGRRNSLRQAPGLPRELPRDSPPRSPRTRINTPASDRLSRSALTTRTTASALRQRSSRDCCLQKGRFHRRGPHTCSAAVVVTPSGARISWTPASQLALRRGPSDRPAACALPRSGSSARSRPRDRIRRDPSAHWRGVSWQTPAAFMGSVALSRAFS